MLCAVLCATACAVLCRAVPQGDVVLRVSSTCICGSDLHLYLGSMVGLQAGDILGHEFMGTVEAVGDQLR